MFQVSENFYYGIESNVKVVTNIKEDENKIINYEHKIFARKYSDFFIYEGRFEHLNTNITSQIMENSNCSIRKNKHTIEIYILEDIKRIEIEEMIIAKIRNIFEQNKIVEKIKLKDLYIKSLVSALLSIAGLTLIFSISKYFIISSIVVNVILEIIKIGSWMFMWQALLFMSFSKIEKFEKVKLLNELLNAPIVFSDRFVKRYSANQCQILKGGVEDYEQK